MPARNTSPRRDNHTPKEASEKKSVDRNRQGSQKGKQRSDDARRKQTQSGGASKKEAKNTFASYMRSKYLVPALAVIVLCGVIGFVSYQWYRESQRQVNTMVVSTVQDLANTFKSIDKACSIVGFAHEKNYIDFLNVVKFRGSEVGAMNVANPDAWQGAYVKDNPTMQGKQYVVIAADQGYYIAPGDGVELSDGRVIGKDVKLNRDTDFDALIQDGTLMHKGKPLVVKIR